jgi:limonene-1,2-epoxide hydrolase
MSSLIDIVKSLQSANERRDRAAILAMVTPDLEYHYHVGSKPVHGPEGLGKFLDRYWANSKGGVWKIETFAQSGDKLLMEGFEEFTEINSGRRVMNRYMGMMEFRDGRIARWRDYFQMEKQPQGG